MTATTMTASELASWVGADGTLDADGLKVAVRIIDARQVYGRLQFLVTPMHGEGARWVDASRVMVKRTTRTLRAWLIKAHDSVHVAYSLSDARALLAEHGGTIEEVRACQICGDPDGECRCDRYWYECPACGVQGYESLIFLGPAPFASHSHHVACTECGYGDEIQKFIIGEEVS